MFQNTVKFNSYPQKIPTILIKYGWRRLARSTCTSLIHWTDVAWWDQVRGCLKMLPFCPDPPYFPHTPRSPPLLGLSSELHVARLPTASCDKPSCPLTTSFLMLAGKTRGVAANPHTHTNTHWVQGNIIQEEEEFPNDQTQAAWWVFASPLLCFLCLFFRSPSLYLCLSFISILPTPALYWYLYFCLYWLSRFSFSEKYFYLFFSAASFCLFVSLLFYRLLLFLFRV